MLLLSLHGASFFLGKHSVEMSLTGESCCVHHHYGTVPHSVFYSPQHQYLTEALHWRAQTDPDHVLFVLLNAKVAIFMRMYCMLRRKKALANKSFFSFL